MPIEVVFIDGDGNELNATVVDVLPSDFLNLLVDGTNADGDRPYRCMSVPFWRRKGLRVLHIDGKPQFKDGQPVPEEYEITLSSAWRHK